MKATDSISQLNLLIEENPNDADLLVNRGKCHFTNADYALALADFEKAYYLGRKDNDFLIVYAETLSNLDEDENALPLFDDVLINLIMDGSHGDESNVMTNEAKSNYIIDVKTLHAMSCQKLKKYYDAIGDYSFCIDWDPTNSVHYFDRAGVFSGMGRYEEAVSDLSKALELEPGNSSFLTQRALAFWNMSMEEKALKDLNVVIESGNGAAAEYYIRGCVLQQLGRHAEAIKDYDKTLKEKSDDPDALFARGAAYVVLGEQKKALKDITKALEINPNNPYYTFHLGMLYSQMKDYLNAISQFNRTFELDPKNVQQLGETFSERSIAYHGMGSNKEALLDIHKSVMLSKGRVEEYVNRQKEYSVEISNQFGLSDYDAELIPYWFMIQDIEANPDKAIKAIVGIDEINNIAAAMVAFEKHDLLKRYVDEGLSLNVQTDVMAFRSYQPTPLYFAICKTIRSNIKDLDKMLRLLVSLGADPDMSAGDDTTPLWATCLVGVPIECVRLLLALGANPDKFSYSDGNRYTPLSACLLLESSEDGNDPLPPNDESMAKAKLLLESGADPNLGIDDLPPLMQALAVCDHENLDFIELLIRKGADVNFVNSVEMMTPLLLTYDYNWFEAGQLLVLYGADMEAMHKILEFRKTPHITGLKCAVDTRFKPGCGCDSTNDKTFAFNDIHVGETLNFDCYYIKIEEIDPFKIVGSVTWRESKDPNPLCFDCGSFKLDMEHLTFQTEYLNCAYDTLMSLILELEISKSDDE